MPNIERLMFGTFCQTKYFSSSKIPNVKYKNTINKLYKILEILQFIF